MFSMHRTVAPFHVCLCVKSVTQPGILNHMQGRWKLMKVEGEDVSDPDMLKAVQTAVSVNRSVNRIRIKDSELRWTNVATAIIEGAAHNTTLREVGLKTPYNPHHFQEEVDRTRHANPKLRLVVNAGE